MGWTTRTSYPAAAKARWTGKVITPGAFHHNDEVAQLVRSDALADQGDAVIEGITLVVEKGGKDQDLAIEVGEHPLGAGLGAIDRDDAEVLRSHGSDAGRDDALRFTQVLQIPRLLAITATSTESHDLDLHKGRETPTPSMEVSPAQQIKNFLS
jgi:hypothetical protein